MGKKQLALIYSMMIQYRIRPYSLCNDYRLALCVGAGRAYLRGDYSDKELDEASEMIKEWIR